MLFFAGFTKYLACLKFLLKSFSVINFAIENSNLSKIERIIILHRFGLEGQEPETLAEIGALTGYTPMGVQKAEKRAIGKLKDNELFKELLT